MPNTTTLDNSDYYRAAQDLQVEPAVIKAVAQVESKNSGFYPDGFPVILFERHIFWKHAPKDMRDQWMQIDPAICNPKATPANSYGTHLDQRTKLSKATAWNPTAALKACSWGIFQELGQNYSDVGFDSVDEFVNVMKSGAHGHLAIFVRSIKVRNLTQKMRDQDWDGFAKNYNGSDYIKFDYKNKIAAAYEKAKQERFVPAGLTLKLKLSFRTDLPSGYLENSDDIQSLQRFLKSAGYDIGSHGVDGRFGIATKTALDTFKSLGSIRTKDFSKIEFLNYINVFNLRLSFNRSPDFSHHLKSNEVKQVQVLLSDLGYDIGQSGVDSTYGTDTKNAIENLNGQGTIQNEHFHLDILLAFLSDDRSAESVDFVDRIVGIANDEWDFWGNQEIIDYEKQADGAFITDSTGNATKPIFAKTGRRETEDGFYQRVGRYWKEGVNNPDLDGRNEDQPWSAAFISYVLRKAGAGTRFRYSEGHSQYIRKAIVSKQTGDTSYGSWGYRLTEYAPQVGDLICYVRQTGINYDTPTDGYISHSDIVIGKEPGVLRVIGGNVENSVTMKHIRIDENGHLNDKQKKWFVVLKNRIT